MPATRAQRRTEVLRQVEAVETLMDKVLGQLDTKSLCRAAGANRAWRDAAGADSLWRAICSREGQSLLPELKARRECSRTLKQLYIQRLLCGDGTMPPAIRRTPPAAAPEAMPETRFRVSDFEVRVEVYLLPPPGGSDDAPTVLLFRSTGPLPEGIVLTGFETDGSTGEVSLPESCVHSVETEEEMENVRVPGLEVRVFLVRKADQYTLTLTGKFSESEETQPLQTWRPTSVLSNAGTQDCAEDDDRPEESTVRIDSQSTPWADDPDETSEVVYVTYVTRVSGTGFRDDIRNMKFARLSTKICCAPYETEAQRQEFAVEAVDIELESGRNPFAEWRIVDESDAGIWRGYVDDDGDPLHGIQYETVKSCTARSSRRAGLHRA
eukprot:COSAG04_NODE_188_length_20978_cov_7.733225_18_plen_381_part_00